MYILDRQNCSRKTYSGIGIVSNGSSKVRFVSLLGILTWKKTPKWNSSANEQYEYGHLGRWYIKSTLYKRFLSWNKIFKKIKVITGKTPLLATGPFCAPHSIWLNICFWRVSFVSQYYVFNLSTFNYKTLIRVFWKRFSIFRKFVLKVLDFWDFHFCDCHIKNMPISEADGYFENNL